ncbi:hypothetical protein [Azospirillum argentinense]
MIKAAPFLNTTFQKGAFLSFTTEVSNASIIDNLLLHEPKFMQ